MLTAYILELRVFLSCRRKFERAFISKEFHCISYYGIFPTLLKNISGREYGMIYRGPSFLRSYDSAPRLPLPTLSTLQSAKCLSFSAY
jgi:hypothetical protein